MISSTELKQLRETSIENCKVDRDAPLERRLDTFITQIKNPYLFKVSDITVKLEFGSQKSLEDSLVTLFGTE